MERSTNVDNQSHQSKNILQGSHIARSLGKAKGKAPRSTRLATPHVRMPDENRELNERHDEYR